jgi:hypothetical protein
MRHGCRRHPESAPADSRVIPGYFSDRPSTEDAPGHRPRHVAEDPVGRFRIQFMRLAL